WNGLAVNGFRERIERIELARLDWGYFKKIIIANRPVIWNGLAVNGFRERIERIELVKCWAAF
ncbi:MAG: hypothetical protein ACPGWR_31500, partial [Ardenticatenaceae bacterium]